jgi:membrane protease YdiL (CAAX protease family)
MKSHFDGGHRVLAPMRPVRAAIWIAVTGAFAALNFYAASRADDRGQDAVYSYDILAGAVVAYGLLLVFVFAITPAGTRRDLLALRRPHSWWRALGTSALAVVMILVGAYLALALAGAGDEQNLTPEEWDGSRAGQYAASFVAVVLIGPVVEELLYRGAGLGLLRSYGTGFAVVTTAILFGFGHGLLLSLGAFIWFGLVVAVVRLRTGSIYPAMLVHAMFNALGMTVPLFV